MRIFDNMRVGTKLTGGFLIVALILVIVAAVGYSNLKQVAEGTTSMYFDRLKPIEELGLARTALYTARGHLYKAVVELDSTDEIARDIKQQLDIVTAQLELYRITNLAPEEKVELTKIDAAWPAYRQGVTEDLRLIRSGDTRTVLANLAKGGSTSKARLEVGQAILRLSEIEAAGAEARYHTAEATSRRASISLAAASLIGVLLAIALGVSISRNINLPLGETVGMIQELSLGHLGGRLQMDRRDEIGVMAAAMDRFADDLQVTVVGTIKRIADGDLSADVVAKDTKDEIVPALKTTIESLRGLVAEAPASPARPSTASSRRAVTAPASRAPTGRSCRASTPPSTR